MTPEDIKRLRLEITTLERKRDALNAELGELGENIRYSTKKIEEFKVFEKRQKKQCDEMLPYREMIQKEIDSKKKELEILESSVLKMKTKEEEMAKARQKNEWDFVKENQQRIHYLGIREEKLTATKREYEVLTDKLNKEIETYGEKTKTLNGEIFLWQERHKEFDKKSQGLLDEEARMETKGKELDKREQYISGSEAKTREKEAQVEGIFKQIDEEKTLLKRENESILIQKKLLNEQQKSIDDDRTHLYSQQEAFKLAVREAKRRWPTLK